MKTRKFLILPLIIALIAFVVIGFSTQTAHAANCDGLQLTGNIPAGTYTLTDNCVITGTLIVDTGTVTINGDGFAIDANNAFDDVLYVAIGATLNLNNVTVTGANEDGVQNEGTLTITNSTFSANTNAGILNAGGTLTVTNSTFSANTNAGIFNNGGTATVTNSTFSGNNTSGIWNNGTVTVTNSTFSGNNRGIYNTGFGMVTVTNSTFSANTNDGIFNAGSSGTVTITNSIVSGNPGGNCGGIIGDNGGNMENGNNCGFADFPNTDPMLGTFNGTYHPLLAGSPAIDGAPDCAGLTNDQIGTARPQGTACDIGAIEVEQIVIADPVTGETVVEIVQPVIPAGPSLNDWNATADEDRAHGWDTDDNVYGTVHMQNGAWQYNAGGIPQELIDYGVIMAVDVWEQGGDQYFDTYERVCLLGEGRLIFFDATQSPRPMVELPVDFEDGYTCGWIPNAGTLVLIVPGE